MKPPTRHLRPLFLLIMLLTASSALSASTIILQTTPAADQTGVIRLSGEGGIVRFMIDADRGEFETIAIDLNIQMDSDGDGTPGNDADNRLHSSYAHGGVWQVSLRPAPGETLRGVVLVATKRNGETVEERRTIVFDPFLSRIPPPVPPAPPALPVVEPAITTDREEIRVGEPFTLRVLPTLPGVTRYAWDLQSDGISDTETTDGEVLLEPDAPGVLPVSVTLVDTTGTALRTLSAEFTVLSIPTPEFPPMPPLETGGQDHRIVGTANGLTASFRIEPGGPLDLLRLEPTWSFGDGARSFLLTPSHTYPQAGTYSVALTLTDPETGAEVVRLQSSLTMSGVAAVQAPARFGEGRPSIWSAMLAPVMFVLKVVFWTALPLLIAGGAFLLWKRRLLKGKEGDSFGSILADLKQRLLRSPLSKQTPELETVSPAQVEDVIGTSAEEEEDIAPLKLGDGGEPVEEPGAVEQGPMPDWLKNGLEVSEEPPDTPPPPLPPPPSLQPPVEPEPVPRPEPAQEPPGVQSPEPPAESKSPLTEAERTSPEQNHDDQFRAKRRERRRRYRQRRKERERLARLAGVEPSTGGTKDEPIAFITAEDIAPAGGKTKAPVLLEETPEENQ